MDFIPSGYPSLFFLWPRPRVGKLEPLGYFCCIPVITAGLGFVCLEAILDICHEFGMKSFSMDWKCRMYKLRNKSSSHLYLHRFFHHRLLPVPNRNLSAHI